MDAKCAGRYAVRFDDLLALWAVVCTRAPDFALAYHTSKRAAEDEARANERHLAAAPAPAKRHRAV